MSWAAIDLLALYSLQFLTLMRVLTRENRESASRVAWMFVVLALPGLGIVLYCLVGEVRFGSRHAARMRTVMRHLPTSHSDVVTLLSAADGPETRTLAAPEVPRAARGAFARAASVNRFQTVGGNAAELMPEGDAAIDRLVADIDAARDHVHFIFYIWLDDISGRKVVDALCRAAGRGVACRCLADGLGSRRLIGSRTWHALRAAGVRAEVTFSTRLPALRVLIGRIDIRNHRKIVVIDGRLAYAGSQNCADAAFEVKRRYAPWVDVLMRFEGPIAWQMQQLFATDWMSHTNEDISAVLSQPVVAHEDGFAAIAFGSGPAISPNAFPDVVTLALAAAQHEVFITTPYYVPTTSVQDQLRSTALRGVAVTLILPRRNDSRIVAYASRSFYDQLLCAGVRIFEFRGGLLHAKTLTVDGRMALIGSANLDRRSFEINFENNVLLADPGVTGALRARQFDYLARSQEVSPDSLRSWPLRRRLANNLLATLGPLL